MNIGRVIEDARGRVFFKLMSSIYKKTGKSSFSDSDWAMFTEAYADMCLSEKRYSTPFMHFAYSSIWFFFPFIFCGGFCGGFWLPSPQFTNFVFSSVSVTLFVRYFGALVAWGSQVGEDIVTRYTVSMVLFSILRYLSPGLLLGSFLGDVFFYGFCFWFVSFVFQSAVSGALPFLVVVGFSCSLTFMKTCLAFSRGRACYFWLQEEVLKRLKLKHSVAF